MVQALVTPQLIKWARERRSLRLEEAAGKINVGAEKLRKWEHGDDSPTFKQAKNLAEKLYIPFGYLFLNNPPDDSLPLPDFRTVTGEQRKSKPSPDFLDVLRDTLRKQQWYREYQQENEANGFPFVGKYSQADNPKIIAEDIVNTFKINQNMRDETHNWEQFLQLFIRKVEELGVLIFRNGIVGNNTHRPLDVEEFRGFVISDNIAPVIFINGKDAKTAQIFTLAHELAHLWMGQTGVSNPNYLFRLMDPQNDIERHANQVAAETLLPSQELSSKWNNSISKTENIEILARQYRISKFVVLRRAFDNDKLSKAEYFNYYEELINGHHRPTGSSGGNFYKTLLARNSTTLTTTLLIACAEGRISTKDTASLLNVKVSTIPVIQREIFKGSEDA
ncbi:MAG: ImmA/IrrE family metallo-endopeptidase [Dehalococcoidales bacterium]|nr:ImmA/IrrE family metallo-endopeptidase [Dehalococcoidales bacterium]